LDNARNPNVWIFFVTSVRGSAIKNML